MTTTLWLFATAIHSILLIKSIQTKHTSSKDKKTPGLGGSISPKCTSIKLFYYSDTKPRGDTVIYISNDKSCDKNILTLQKRSSEHRMRHISLQTMLCLKKSNSIISKVYPHFTRYDFNFSNQFR